VRDCILSASSGAFCLLGRNWFSSVSFLCILLSLSLYLGLLRCLVDPCIFMFGGAFLSEFMLAVLSVCRFVWTSSCLSLHHYLDQRFSLLSSHLEDSRLQLPR